MLRFVYFKGGRNINICDALFFRKFGGLACKTLPKPHRIPTVRKCSSTSKNDRVMSALLAYPHLFVDNCRLFSSKASEDVMNVFDRSAKRIQRNRTALVENYAVYDYIKDEVLLISRLIEYCSLQAI